MRDSGVLEKSCDRGSNPRGANTSLFIFCDMKYYMELFMPSERILKEIGWDKDGQRIYFTNVANASESVLRGTVASAKTIITDVYRFQFEREDIKQRFENKIPLTEFDMDVSSRRVGVRDYIYNLSDIIEVDTANGILFCVQYFGNFREWREH